MIKVEVVFALPDKATSLTVDVPEGTSAEQAVLQSGILEQCPEVDANNLTLGVWNRTVKLHHLVKKAIVSKFIVRLLPTRKRPEDAEQKRQKRKAEPVK